MVAAAYPAVKDEAPDSTVLVGGLAAHGRRDGIPPLEFLRELACVDGRLRPVDHGGLRATSSRSQGDGFAHHPYSTRTRPGRRWSARPRRDDVPLARIGEADRHARPPGRRGPHLAEAAQASTSPSTPTSRTRPTPARASTPARRADDGLRRGAGRARAAGAHVRPVHGARPAGHGARRAAGGRACSDWQSGLLFTDRRPKPLACVLPAPLHVERVDPQFVRLWGRVRPGRGQAPGADRGVASGGAPGGRCSRAAPTVAASSRPRAGAGGHRVQDRAPGGRALGVRARR